MTTIRLPIKIAEHLKELAEANEISQSKLIIQAIEKMYDEYSTGDIWRGQGVWRGWRLTTAHPASSYRQPVLVDPEGTAYGPADITGKIFEYIRR